MWPIIIVYWKNKILDMTKFTSYGNNRFPSSSTMFENQPKVRSASFENRRIVMCVVWGPLFSVGYKGRFLPVSIAIEKLTWYPIDFIHSYAKGTLFWFQTKNIPEANSG